MLEELRKKMGITTLSDHLKEMRKLSINCLKANFRNEYYKNSTKVSDEDYFKMLGEVDNLINNEITGDSMIDPRSSDGCIAITSISKYFNNRDKEFHDLINRHNKLLTKMLGDDARRLRIRNIDFNNETIEVFIYIFERYLSSFEITLKDGVAYSASGEQAYLENEKPNVDMNALYTMILNDIMAYRNFYGDTLENNFKSINSYFDIFIKSYDHSYTIYVEDKKTHELILSIDSDDNKVTIESYDAHVKGLLEGMEDNAANNIYVSISSLPLWIQEDLRNIRREELSSKKTSMWQKILGRK